jgi:hypothetical protein
MLNPYIAAHLIHDDDDDEPRRRILRGRAGEQRENDERDSRVI